MNNDAEQRENQLIAETLGALDVLELWLWSDGDTKGQSQSAAKAPIFQEGKP